MEVRGCQQMIDVILFPVKLIQISISNYTCADIQIFCKVLIFIFEYFKNMDIQWYTSTFCQN